MAVLQPKYGHWTRRRIAVVGHALDWLRVRKEPGHGIAHAVMGMDWHSSGITTSVMGALKRGLNPRADELGPYICGGRGEQSRRTPDELRRVADRTSLDGDALVRTSRLTARIDNNAIADGFQIYLHSFVVTATVSGRSSSRG